VKSRHRAVAIRTMIYSDTEDIRRVHLQIFAGTMLRPCAFGMKVVRGHHTVSRSNSHAGRRVADLASQRKLGVCAKRGLGWSF
jgi:hypothetical protein